MRQLFITALLLFSMPLFAEDAKNEWHNTTLSDATIKKIQDVKYNYNKCITADMRKIDYMKQDSRFATENIIKACEPNLAEIRKVYLEEKVPEVIADRHLKQIRIQTTRGVLQQMMMLEAARKANPQATPKTPVAPTQ